MITFLSLVVSVCWVPVGNLCYFVDSPHPPLSGHKSRVDTQFQSGHFAGSAPKRSCLNQVTIIALKKRIISLDTTGGPLFMSLTVSWHVLAKVVIGSGLLPALYLYAPRLTPCSAHRCGNVQIMKDRVNKQTAASVMEQKLLCDAWLVKWFLSE